jgi:hypothetical protein
VKPGVGDDWSRTPWAADVPLSWLKRGKNEFYFPASAYVHVHDICIRIYYNSRQPLKGEGDVTPPEGKLLDTRRLGKPDVDSNKLVLEAEARDADSGVKRVEFFALYEGYDEDNDGVFYEWHGINHNNKNPGGLVEAPEGGTIDHCGTALEGEDGVYRVTWDLKHVPNQQPRDTAFRIRIIDNAGNVTESAGGARNLVKLSRNYRVQAFYNPGFSPACLQHGDWNLPKTYSTEIELPDDVDKATSAYLLGHYLNSPAISINSSKEFRVQIPKDAPWGAPWTLDVSPVDVSTLKPGINTITYRHVEGWGEFIERPGPMIVLHYPPQEVAPLQPRPAVNRE